MSSAPVKALEKAKADYERWSAELIDSEEILGHLDSGGDDMGDIDPDDLDEAARDRGEHFITTKARIDVCWSQIYATRQRIVEAQKALVRWHLEQERKELSEARKKLTSHQGKVERKLAELRDLDSTEYVPIHKLRVAKAEAEIREHLAAGSGSVTIRNDNPSTTDRLQIETRRLATRIAVYEYWLETGHKPEWANERRHTDVNHVAGIFSRQLNNNERPDAIYGPDADIPEPPKREDKADPTKWKMSAPTW
jgi:hypothetical protein